MFAYCEDGKRWRPQRQPLRPQADQSQHVLDRRLASSIEPCENENRVLVNLQVHGTERLHAFICVANFMGFDDIRYGHIQINPFSLPLIQSYDQAPTAQKHVETDRCGCTK